MDRGAPVDHEPMLLAGSVIFVLLCWVMPAVYLLVLWQAKLKSLAPILPLHMSSVAWREPFVAVMTGLALLNLAGVHAIGRYGLAWLRRRTSDGKVDSRGVLLVGAIVSACLLETVSIYGLVLSFAMQGKNVLPLALVLMAAAPLGHLLLWPWPSRWREAVDPSAIPGNASSI